jgi:hypothetical protein
MKKSLKYWSDRVTRESNALDKDFGTGKNRTAKSIQKRKTSNSRFAKEISGK